MTHSKTHNSNAQNEGRGSGDTKTGITVKVIDNTTCSATSSSTIHKLSRGEICKTLNNIRTYLKVNATSKNTATRNKKSSLPTPDDESPLQSTPGISPNTGFLSLNSVDINGVRSPILSEATEYENGSFPWLLESRKNRSTGASSSVPKPRPTKPQNSVVSNTSCNTAASASKCFRPKSPNPRPRWTYSSTPQKTEYSYLAQTATEDSEATSIGGLLLRGQEEGGGQQGGVNKNSAIYRFQKFLQKNRKPVPHVGVNVCIQPEIVPEVVEAIKELYDKHYGPSTHNCYNYEFDDEENDMDYEYLFQDNDDAQPVYDKLKGDNNDAEPEFQEHMYGKYADQNYELQQHPCDPRQASTSNCLPHHELLDFPLEPNHFCHKRRTKFTMKPKQPNMFPYHGPQFQHTHPSEPIRHSYQNILTNNQYGNYEMNQFNPPPHPAGYYPNMASQPQYEGNNDGNQFQYQYPRHDEVQQYYQNNEQSGFEQQPNSYSYPNQHFQITY